jgi:DNA invertase Pin-like site-specific DNA recombinase
MIKQLPAEVMRASSKARRKRRIKAAKAQGKWIVKKKFRIVSVDSDEWNFSNCTGTREIVASLSSYIDRLIKWNNAPTITFIDEHGKRKNASFSSLCGVEIDDA